MNLPDENLSKQVFSYARASSVADATSKSAMIKQMAQLLSAGVDPNNILLDLELGTSSVRPAFNELIQQILNGRVESVIVTSCSRITRSVDCWSEFQSLLNHHHVQLIVLEQGGIRP